MHEQQLLGAILRVAGEQSVRKGAREVIVAGAPLAGALRRHERPIVDGDQLALGDVQGL